MRALAPSRHSGRTTLILIALMAATTIVAQQSKRATAPTGSVTGHIYLADTNGPARMVYLTLVPAKDLESSDKAGTSSGGDPVAAIVTGLDGSFEASHVPPGIYYASVSAPGYLSPSLPTANTNTKATVKANEINAVTDWTKASPPPERIIVEANQTVTLELRLERGAALSGTLTFDDGTPAPQTPISVLKKDAEGKWEAPQLSGINGASSASDDLGHYRIPSLPPGEYRIEAELRNMSITVSWSNGHPSGTSTSSTPSILFYAPGALREKDAALYKLSPGEEVTGADIIIPLSKLHKVQGTLTAAHDGHVINAGSVSLLLADDRTQMAETVVDKEDDSFHFEYVPEGDYLLSTLNARDVTREEIPNCPNCMPASVTEETELHAYGPSEQAITIRGETTGLALAVPEKSAVTRASAQQPGTQP